MMNNTELRNHLKQLEIKILVIYCAGFLVIVTLSLVSNFIMKNESAKQATSMIKRTVARDFREVVYTLNDAELDYFKSVIYFNQDGERLFSLPATLDLQTIQQRNFWNRLVDAQIETNLYFDPQEKNKIGSVVYVFNRFSHVPWAIAIWLFFLLGTIPLMRDSRHRLTKNFERDVKLREESTRADLAQRVRHDIRSPLGALQIATQDLSFLPERQSAIIKKATERIKEIVSELELIRVTSASVPTDKMRHSILTVVQDIVQEKRTRLNVNGKISINPEFAEDSFFLFSEFCAPELKRALSNIIENSVEAVGAGGQINVRISGSDSAITIEVEDNGKGIPNELLILVADKGFSFGKSGGTGLGLYYAKKTAEDSGGSLRIESILGQATKVQIVLPRCSPPRWYTNHILVPNEGTVVILDDQETSHLSVRTRLDGLRDLGGRFSVEAFKKPADFLKWYHAESTRNKRKSTVYLFDYDLGRGRQNGLEIADSLGLQSNAFLMTGHFDLESIQKQCLAQKMKLIPKSQLSSIELKSI